MSVPEKSEVSLVAWICGQSSTRLDGSVTLGIGDDMAMVRTGPDVLVTADMLMDFVDFDSNIHSPHQIGRKALAVSLSDCAAMAVRPRWAVVSVALPNSWTMEQAKALHTGVQALADGFEVRIIGGDTNSWNRPLVIDVTVIAEPWPNVRPVTRSGMRPGDSIWVSGPLGGSHSGRHMTFEPRVREAFSLASSLGPAINAMLDLSDGLSLDGSRLCTASGCGMELDEAKLIQAATQDARLAAREDGKSLLDHVLNDGEDFELLFAVAAGEQRVPIETVTGAGHTVTYQRIGVATEEPGMRLRSADGSVRPIEPKGWQHFTEHP